MRTLERISLVEAACRLGISVTDAARLVEAGSVNGSGGWVFVESLDAYIACH